VWTLVFPVRPAAVASDMTASGCVVNTHIKIPFISSRCCLATNVVRTHMCSITKPPPPTHKCAHLHSRGGEEKVKTQQYIRDLEAEVQRQHEYITLLESQGYPHGKVWVCGWGWELHTRTHVHTFTKPYTHTKNPD